MRNSSSLWTCGKGNLSLQNNNTVEMANLIRSMIYTKGIKTKDIKSLKQLCVTIRNNNEER